MKKQDRACKPWLGAHIIPRNISQYDPQPDLIRVYPHSSVVLPIILGWLIFLLSAYPLFSVYSQAVSRAVAMGRKLSLRKVRTP